MAIFIVIFLSLGIAAQQAVCERYHIVTSSDSPCPGEHNGEFCFTLQQFILTSTTSQRLTLELEPGIHTLESRLTITGTDLIEIIGHNATIICPPYYYSLWLNLRYIERVIISGITFIDCHRIYLYDVYNATISGSKFDTQSQLGPLSAIGLDIQTTNISIHLCTFTGQSTGMNLYSTNSSITSCGFFGNARGIYLAYSEVTVLDSTFRDNGGSSSGGAIYMYHTNSLSVINSNFVRNTASPHGGAIYIDHTNSLSVINSNFIRNTASSHGGAIYTDHNNALSVVNGGFYNNTASYGGGAILYMDVYFSSSVSFSTLMIDSSIFADNSGYQGGALSINIRYWYSYPSRHSNCTVNRSVFINNKAIRSGGVISAVGNVLIMNSIFGYNTAPQCAVFASAIGSQQQSQQFESSIFLYNQATNSTAGDDNVQYLGGVACLSDTSLTVNNCTFSHNMAKDGGGVLNVEDSNVTISRSSFHNNSAEIDGGVLYTYFLSSTFVLTECSFTNNRAGDDGGVIYIGKTQSNVDIRRSSFSHNVANDRGGAIIVFGSTIGMEYTNMHNNEANSGDDIGVCTASNISSSSSTYFTLFLQRIYSTPCILYSSLTSVFNIRAPEDHSNTNLAQYFEIANQYESHNDPQISTTPEASSTLITTTDPERELLENLRNELSETSSMQYAILAFCLLFIVILVTVIVVKFRTCLKKKATNTGNYDLDKCNTSNEYNDNESVEIYEEPVWKNDRPDAIRVKPNVGYGKHTF